MIACFIVNNFRIYSLTNCFFSNASRSCLDYFFSSLGSMMAFSLTMQLIIYWHGEMGG